MKLWIVDFDEAHPIYDGMPVVIRSREEPTTKDAERLIHTNGSMGTVYINSIKPTSEIEIRYKGYPLLGD